MCCIRKDLLKTQHFLGLMLCTASNITARIPLQSAARTSHADSFSPGEAIGAAAPLDKVNNKSSYPFGFWKVCITPSAEVSVTSPPMTRLLLMSTVAYTGSVAPGKFFTV